MFKPVRNLIGAGVLAVLTAAAVGLARFLPKLWFSFYTDFSRKAMGALGAAFGWVPFPIWEALLVLIVVALIAGLIYAVKEKKLLGWLTGVLAGAALLVFLFMGLWGLNHFAPTIGEQTGLEVKEYSVDQLKAAAAWYTDMASYYSQGVERDGNGDVILPGFDELAGEALVSYERLAEYNERFAVSNQRVKPMLVSKAFAYMGITGVFVF